MYHIIKHEKKLIKHDKDVYNVQHESPLGDSVPGHNVSFASSEPKHNNNNTIRIIFNICELITCIIRHKLFRLWYSMWNSYSVCHRTIYSGLSVISGLISQRESSFSGSFEAEKCNTSRAREMSTKKILKNEMSTNVHICVFLWHLTRL